MCLVQGHNTVPPMKLKPATHDLESRTLPLSHLAPLMKKKIQIKCYMEHEGVVTFLFIIKIYL